MGVLVPQVLQKHLYAARLLESPELAQLVFSPHKISELMSGCALGYRRDGQDAIKVFEAFTKDTQMDEPGSGDFDGIGKCDLRSTHVIRFD